MPGITMRTNKMTRRKLLIAVTTTLTVLALSLSGWVYKAKTQHDLNMKLLGAVRKGNAEESRLLLASGANPNIRDVPENPLSFWQQMRLALRLEPKKDEPTDSQTSTVLEMALYFESSSEPGLVNDNTLLVKALLDAGARPDDTTSDHETPLMWAVSRNQLKTIQTLLDHGANPLAKDNFGETPIFYLQDDTGYQIRNEIKIAELLIKLGSDVNAVDIDGETPLLCCVHKRSGCDIALLRFLLAKGAKVNARTKEGVSILLKATKVNDREATRILLNAGADASVSDSDKNTPLNFAAFSGSLPIVEMLLTHHAKIEPIDSEGNTPLTTTLNGEDNPDVVGALIHRGADVNHRNKAGDTPLALAQKSKFMKSIRLLKAAGARP